VKLKNKKFVAAAFAFGLLVPQGVTKTANAETTSNPVVKLRILETSDIHENLMNYDYYQSKE